MAASLLPSNSSPLQQMLQSAVKAVQWTYSIFWQFCSQQGTLIWVDGYYNGYIKTRKTLQPTEGNGEEGCGLERSQQLKELYYSLLAGELSHQLPPPRRLFVALSPEDLTDLEWFYLLCISFSFPPGVGLPGKAYAKGSHIWLTGAHEVENNIFSRSILAKSANIQTVVCIPLIDGVVELGYTEQVEEDSSFILEMKKMFTNHQGHHQHDHYCYPSLPQGSPPNPTTSMANPTPVIASANNQCDFPLIPMYAVEKPPFSDYDDRPTRTADDERDHDNFNANGLLYLDAETEQKNIHGLEQRNKSSSPVDHHEQSELMQAELFDDIQLSSPDYASDNQNCELHAMVRSMEQSSQLGNCQGGSVQPVRLVERRPNAMLDQRRHVPLFFPSESYSTGGALALDEQCEDGREDTHYSQILSTILQSQHSASSTPTSTILQFPTSPTHCISSSSHNSAFSKWILNPYKPLNISHYTGIPQTVLKYILFTVPSLHASTKPAALATSPSLSHVLAERRRREKLNDRFVALRSMVPFVTKSDKASILGDAIEYVKHLRNKIQDLEARVRHLERKRGREVRDVGSENGNGFDGFERRKLEVSIIENDALVELHCQHREGLLLDVMLALRDLDVEVIAVQSSLHDGYLVAELRAKAKENCKGKKATIVEVKRAIKQVVTDGQ